MELGDITMTGPENGKSLLLLRHAKSDRKDADLPDHDRPLTSRGTRDAGRLGRLLRDENLLPDLIITSTARRARQTVEAIVAATGYAGPVMLKRTFYLAAPEAYLEVVAGLSDDEQRVLVVGHNPGLENLAEQLSGAYTTMSTATLVEVVLSITHWQELNETTRGELRAVWRP